MNYITGNKFKNISDFILDEKGFRNGFNKNDIPIYFIKTDYLNLFFQNFLPKTKFKLITHNSDLPVDEKFINFLENENLLVWFGQNIKIKHPKIESIPIGIANEMWAHGDEKKIDEIMNNQNIKNNLIYSNFDINTNRFERIKCLNSILKHNLVFTERRNFSDYLNDLKSSFFCLSPNGNGIDCHKIWESLYFKTIPIVTKSINISFYEKLPILIIQDWETFDPKNINENLYNSIIKKWNQYELNFDFYLNKIKNYERIN